VSFYLSVKRIYTLVGYSLDDLRVNWIRNAFVMKAKILLLLKRCKKKYVPAT